AQSAVAEVMRSSLMVTTAPTVSNSLVTRSNCSSDALSDAMQVIDWPMAIAVLGIARITWTLLLSLSRTSAQVTPDTTDTTNRSSGTIAEAISSSTPLSCCGNTANTMTLAS